MYHEAPRRRLGYSVDQRRRREKRASNWLIALGSIWLAFIVLLIWSLPTFMLSLISEFPFGAIFAVLLLLGCTISGRFK